MPAQRKLSTGIGLDPWGGARRVVPNLRRSHLWWQRVRVRG